MSLAWDEDTAVALPHGELITGLTRLVGLLLDQAQGPAFEFSQVTMCVQGSNSDQIAQVRQWAQVFDVQHEWIEDHTVRACTQLGPLSVMVFTHFQQEPDAQATVTQPAVVDENALPETDCPVCFGTGRNSAYGGETCAFCLGKGRILAWAPREEQMPPQILAEYRAAAATSEAQEW